MVPIVQYSLSIFFPCYNEAANIESLVTKAFAVLPTISDDFEIILVNDGSSDETGEIIERLAQQHHAVKAVHHRVNSGYGAALQSGFKAASKEWVFYTDGDGQFDISELPWLFEFVDECDVVSCYRINRQ